MRNYDYWKDRKELNKNKIIFILSWMFYRTFNTDWRYLSDKFWFKIKHTWWYEVVWFPKNALEKYLNELKKQKIWYIIYKKWDDNEFNIENEYKWWSELKYNKEKLIYIEKENNNEKVKKDFQSFLKDLEKLILKYK